MLLLVSSPVLVVVIPRLIICVIFTGYPFLIASTSRFQSSYSAVSTVVLPPTYLVSSLSDLPTVNLSTPWDPPLFLQLFTTLFLLLHVLKLMAEGRSPTMCLLYGINYRCLSAPALPSPAFALHLKLTIFVLHIDLISLCQSWAKRRLWSSVLV
jgi:hypothetical protein